MRDGEPTHDCGTCGASYYGAHVAEVCCGGTGTDAFPWPDA